MITSTTPYKLAEIVRDTWPNLYRPPVKVYNKVYTPEGYLLDPPDSVCPYCGKKQRSCSYVNSVSRAWARERCAKENTSKSTKR